nr:LamG domain-containing protein [Planctomycetota bacterium]
ISTSNQWHFRVGSTSGNANVPAAPGATQEWHFVVMTHDADATTLRGYLDGRMIYENTSSDPAPLTAESPLWIGGAQGVTEYYPGTLDEVRIYNRVLSSGEMSFVGAQ